MRVTERQGSRGDEVFGLWKPALEFGFGLLSQVCMFICKKPLKFSYGKRVMIEEDGPFFQLLFWSSTTDGRKRGLLFSLSK